MHLLYLRKPFAMNLTPRQLNRYLMFKLPSAFLCGVRVKSLNSTSCLVTVKHSWINQNPFNSMYFAVQAMAAELSTGALVMTEIRNTNTPISMLVASNKSSFSKKATGLLTFSCHGGNEIRDAIQKATTTGEGVTCWMKSVGTNEAGEIVSEMDFEWTLRRRVS